MIKFDKQFAYSMGVSAGVALVAEVLIYSYVESKKGNFKIHLPTHFRALEVIAGSLATGLATGVVLQLVQQKTMSKEEQELTALYEKERAKVKAGLVKDSSPVQVVWQPYELIAKA